MENKMKFKIDENSSVCHYRPKSRVLMKLTPDEFLCLARSEVELEEETDRKKAMNKACVNREEFPLDERRTQVLKDRIKEGIAFDPPFLDFDVALEEITAHEGRHRAKAAKELGIKEYPVLIFFRQSGEFIDVNAEAQKLFEDYKEGCEKCGAAGK